MRGAAPIGFRHIRGAVPNMLFLLQERSKEEQAENSVFGNKQRSNDVFSFLKNAV